MAWSMVKNSFHPPTFLKCAHGWRVVRAARRPPRELEENWQSQTWTLLQDETFYFHCEFSIGSSDEYKKRGDSYSQTVPKSIWSKGVKRRLKGEILQFVVFSDELLRETVLCVCGCGSCWPAACSDTLRGQFRKQASKPKNTTRFSETHSNSATLHILVCNSNKGWQNLGRFLFNEA